jgi:hypothetical protein
VAVEHVHLTKRQLRVSAAVGLASIPIGLVMMFMSMGLPLSAILVPIPAAILLVRMLGRPLSRGEALSREVAARGGLVAGALDSLGVLIPLAVLAAVAPPTATLGAELAKELDPALIPAPLNDFRVAIALIGVACSALQTGLTFWCSRLLAERIGARLSLGH